MCDVGGIFVQGPELVMWNACIPMIMVTLFVAMSLYQVYVWT